MIEISSTSPNKDEKTKVKSKKKSSSVSEKDSPFRTTLKSIVTFEFQGTIEELTNELKDQEKRFLDQQSPYELNRYKALVQKILKTILDEGFKTGSLKRTRKDRADFVIIQEINEKLLEISMAITRKNNEAFNLLKKIEEIRGLILDLVS